MASEPYCTCKYQQAPTIKLHLPVTDKHIPTVCTLCMRPKLHEWKFWIEVCRYPSCRAIYSSPWEDCCEECFETMKWDREYRSWTRVAEALDSRLVAAYSRGKLSSEDWRTVSTSTLEKKFLTTHQECVTLYPSADNKSPHDPSGATDPPPDPRSEPKTIEIDWRL